MTPSSIRSRPFRAASCLPVRAARAVLGGAVGVVWLVLPGTTTSTGVPMAVTADRPAASASAQGGASAADLVLPLVTAGAAAVLAGYGYVRRTRRARTRTTPGGAPAPPAPRPAARDDLSEADGRARALLVEADDCVRTSREELGFAEARFGAAAVAPFARVLREAEAELATAFGMRQRYDEGTGQDAGVRRQVLAGIVGRCQEAGRRLDAEAAGFDRLRGLERDPRDALVVAEQRFRELAARTGAADGLLARLRERYPASATAPVVGHVEQATDRLLFATSRLNRARQCADRGETARAAGHLRAAEGAVAQAAVFLHGVDRLAAELAAARAMVPAALTGAEAEIAGARERSAVRTGADAGAEPATGRDVPAGELRARVLRADAVLAAVRQEVTGGPYDPLDALRRIVRATLPLADGRAGVLPAAARLVADSAVAAAADYVTTHRGAVGCAARTRLAEAQRLLGPDPQARAEAEARARQARELAERDVRAHGTPLGGVGGHGSGAGGALLGGILLGGTPGGGPPASFGGPRTRSRRGVASA
ncbi:hypothetical protein [Streptomyces sp. NPDC052701]|uniref:hypothetical protein n=1 Tax=Streptomyces sp. NPDC052701 TaxID=3155533 RepID=UPI00342DF645